MVLLYHVRETTQYHWLAPHGFLAVDFFFVLSGFVIAHAYRTKLESGELSPGRFILRRYARLWPTAALGTVLGVVNVYLGQIPMEYAAVPMFLLLGVLKLPALGPSSLGQFFPLNPPQWSLFDEIAANAFYGIGAFKLRLKGLLVFTIVAGVLTAWLLVATKGTQYAGAQRVLYPYLAGTLAYELRSRGVRCQWPWLGWGLAALTLLGLWMPEATGTHEVLIFGGLSLVVFPLTVWGASELDVPRLRGFCNLSGDVSYPLYAIHYPLLLTALDFDVPAGVIVVAICVASWGVARWYDIPIRHALMRLIAGGSPPVVSAPLLPTRRL